MSEWKVWYQPTAQFGRRYFSGDLRIERGQATFTGKKDTFSITGAKSVEPKIVGMKTWIHVAYDSGDGQQDGYFLDRRMLGWSGMTGGNDRLRDELRDALLS